MTRAGVLPSGCGVGGCARPDEAGLQQENHRSQAWPTARAKAEWPGLQSECGQQLLSRTSQEQPALTSATASGLLTRTLPLCSASKRSRV